LAGAITNYGTIEMRRLRIVKIAAGMLTVANIAAGHGIPISVTVDGSNKLIASNLQPLYTPTQVTSGYAPMVLVDNEAVDIMDHIIVNSAPLGLSGPYAFTTLPGFNVSGLDPASPLFLQVISRPVQGMNPVAGRLLWHWSATNHKVVVDSSGGESLTIASDAGNTVQSITVPQTDGGPLTIKVADPVQNGIDEHYLEYLLGDPPADEGAYAFFARLISPAYVTSDPFLVILNDGIDDTQDPGELLTAALAINKAALLAGDYDHNDVVDAADWTLWKTTFGSTTQLAAEGNGDGIVNAADYTVWRDHFGQSASGISSASGVPEPPSFALLLAAVLLLCIVKGGTLGRNSFLCRAARLATGAAIKVPIYSQATRRARP
jgi:hypothetical protein